MLQSKHQTALGWLSVYGPVWVGLFGCVPDLRTPQNLAVTCESSDACPSGKVCVAELGTCRAPSHPCITEAGSAYRPAAPGTECDLDGEAGVCVHGICQASSCGDGVVHQNKEGCDDGNQNIEDDCPDGPTGSCRPATCGDGFVRRQSADPDLIERCDDGNLSSGDGCSADCQVLESCGDGKIDTGEQCDDDNTKGDDGCSPGCQREPDWQCTGEPSICRRCGNGSVEPGEECDDGNTDDGDGCSDQCEQEEGWHCDGAGPRSCEAVCGDNRVLGDEVCDDGNTDDCIGPCLGDCTGLKRCGDGVVCEQDDEVCDDGAANSDTAPDACRTSCTPAACGDGVIDSTEVCDDGNTSGGDDCSADCQKAAECGDGMVQDRPATPGVPDEQCDFGDADVVGCDSECQLVGGYGCDADGCFRVVYVDASAAAGGDGRSWETAFDSLQLALETAEQDDPHNDDLAGSGNTLEEIWIAAGSYVPEDPSGWDDEAFDPPEREYTFVPVAGVALVGGFAGDESYREEHDPQMHKTILSGDLNGNDEPTAPAGDSSLSDNVYHVVSIYGVAEAVLDGLTVRGGHADENNCDPPACNLGGGIRIMGGDSWTPSRYGNNSSGEAAPHVELRDVIVEHNWAELGGGIGVETVGTDPPGDIHFTCDDCIIRENTATAEGAAYYDGVYSATVAFHGGELRANVVTTDGSNAALHTLANLSMTGSVVAANAVPKAGGGLHLAYRDTAKRMDGVVFVDNKAGERGGAIFVSSDNFQCNNCIFIGNSAGTDGGAIYMSDGYWDNLGDGAVTGALFTGNHALNAGQAAFAEEKATLRIYNSVLYEQRVDSAASRLQDVTASHICIGDAQGSGAIQEGSVSSVTYQCAPELVDLDGADDELGSADDNYALAPTSVCIDAGANEHAPSTDYLGQPRIVDYPGVGASAPRVDIGPVELQAP